MHEWMAYCLRLWIFQSIHAQCRFRPKRWTPLCMQISSFQTQNRHLIILSRWYHGLVNASYYYYYDWTLREIYRPTEIFLALPNLRLLSFTLSGMHASINYLLISYKLCTASTWMQHREEGCHQDDCLAKVVVVVYLHALKNTEYMLYSTSMPCLATHAHTLDPRTMYI